MRRVVPMRSIAAAVLVPVLAACGTGSAPPAHAVGDEEEVPAVVEKLDRSDAEWKKVLSPEQYRIAREKGTERAFTGKHWNRKEPGVYRCAACGLPLFSSEAKFDSGTGWPSFWEPIAPTHVAREVDHGFGTVRTEVLCARCGAHLGHVFDDGPDPTGLRYCINSAILEFRLAE